MVETEVVRAHVDVREPTPGGAQGVDRTLDLIEHLAATGGATMSDIATSLGVHRSVVYRMLKSLVARDFVRRQDGEFVLGVAFLAIANAVPHQLRDVARHVVAELAAATGATAYVVVDSGGRSVCVLVVEPDGPQPRVALRPGAWGPMDRGAPAFAILSGRPQVAGEPEAVTRARADGVAVGRGPESGVEWVAAPLHGDSAGACIGVLYPADSLFTEEAAARVKEAAVRVGGTFW